MEMNRAMKGKLDLSSRATIAVRAVRSFSSGLIFPSG